MGVVIARGARIGTGLPHPPTRIRIGGAADVLVREAHFPPLATAIAHNEGEIDDEIFNAASSRAAT